MWDAGQGMVNPLEMFHTVGRGGKERQTRGMGITRDQMEVCLSGNEFLRRGQFI